MAEGPSANLTYWLVDRWADSNPSAPAILGEPAAVTYGQLRELVNRAGQMFRALGYGPGDRVLLCLPDAIEFVAAFLGAAKIGAIPVGIDPWRDAADFAY